MSEIQEAMKKLRTDLPDDLAVVLTLSIRLHKNGAMSVEGPVGDPDFCRKLLDEGWAAIKRNAAEEKPVLIVPGNDVDSRPKESYRT